MSEKKDRLKQFLALAMGLLVMGGCQSVYDDESTLVVESDRPGYQAQGFPEYEVLKNLTNRCDADIAQAYGQRATVAKLHQRDFNLALGQASKACSDVQRALEKLREATSQMEAYYKNLNYAKSLYGGVGGGDSWGDADDMGFAPEKPDIYPTAKDPGATGGPLVVHEEGGF